MTNPTNKGVIDHEMYHKNWELGSNLSTEASILLDMIKTINKKSKYINNRSVRVFQDNKLLIRLINNDIDKENTYTMEVRAKITKIKQIIKQSNILFEII